jgi:hypothetical protein
MEKELTACNNCKYCSYENWPFPFSNNVVCYCPETAKQYSYFDPYYGKVRTVNNYPKMEEINKDGHCFYFSQKPPKKESRFKSWLQSFLR